MTDTHYPLEDADRLDAIRHGQPLITYPDRVAALDDDLQHTLEPYAWLGDLQTGNIRSWSQDMWRDMVWLAEQVQALSEADR